MVQKNDSKKSTIIEGRALDANGDAQLYLLCFLLGISEKSDIVLHVEREQRSTLATCFGDNEVIEGIVLQSLKHKQC